MDIEAFGKTLTEEGWERRLGIAPAAVILRRIQAGVDSKDAVCRVPSNTELIDVGISPRSKYVGVTWHRATRSWMAQIKDGGRVRCLGYFKLENEEDAARAFDKAALERGGATRLNFA